MRAVVAVVGCAAGAFLMVMGMSAGCTLGFDEFVYPPEESGASTSASGGGAGTSSGGAGGMSSAQGGGAQGSGGAIMCGDNPETTRSGCPAVCNDCNNGVCEIDCSGEAACKDETIQCPEGMPCEVVCDGKDACQDAVLACSPAHGCELICEGEKACDKLQMSCGEGTCAIDCADGIDTCLEVKVDCGTNSCEATCEGNNPEPDLACNNSCKCGPC